VQIGVQQCARRLVHGDLDEPDHLEDAGADFVQFVMEHVTHARTFRSPDDGTVRTT